ncbi:hypothetical protein SAMN05443428_10636 [Caloramator quimbayensis]|uniref:Uncharacterized protein n=1 Tax=Caloramator quimbayensis TaxID=1147123 RepID=A0A1T4X691_9CLOT|nr:hypothetical protein SAMN05443428_10636 [Caloramator quimbayensis]
MTNLTPSIGWGWWLLLHIITIPLLFYLGKGMMKKEVD